MRVFAVVPTASPRTGSPASRVEQGPLEVGCIRNVSSVSGTLK